MQTAIEDNSVYIIAIGVQTPIGRCYRSAAAAVRCGISAYREHEFMIDKHGEPMVVANADWLPMTMSAVERMKAFGRDAFADVLRQLKLSSLSEGSCFVGVAEDAGGSAVATAVCDELQRLSPSKLQDIDLEANAVGFRVLGRTMEYVQRFPDQVAFAIVTDSWICPDRLESLDSDGRLHSVNLSWGFTPGEGACAIALATGSLVRQRNLQALGKLHAVSIADESKTLGTRTVCIGEGLTSAFRGALTSTSLVSHSYCDLNGETYRADEFGFAVCRTSQYFEDASRFTAGAQCWGDVGAASSLLGISLAMADWHDDSDKGLNSLIWGSSAANSCRGAARVSSATFRENPS